MRLKIATVLYRLAMKIDPREPMRFTTHRLVFDEGFGVHDWRPVK